jgi:hypothetical protein
MENTGEAGIPATDKSIVADDGDALAFLLDLRVLPGLPSMRAWTRAR